MVHPRAVGVETSNVRDDRRDYRLGGKKVEVMEQAKGRRCLREARPERSRKEEVVEEEAKVKKPRKKAVAKTSSRRGKLNAKKTAVKKDAIQKAAKTTNKSISKSVANARKKPAKVRKSKPKAKSG